MYPLDPTSLGLHRWISSLVNSKKIIIIKKKKKIYIYNQRRVSEDDIYIPNRRTNFIVW